MKPNAMGLLNTRQSLREQQSVKRLLIKVSMTWKRLTWNSKVSVTKLRTRETSPVERESKGWGMVDCGVEAEVNSKKPLQAKGVESDVLVIDG